MSSDIASGGEHLERSISADAKSPKKEATPSIASTSNTTQSTSSSIPFYKNKEHNSSLSSFFHPCRNSPKESALSAMLAPAVNIAGAHNPFIIGGMREDGKRTRPHFHRRGSSDEQLEDTESVTSEDASRSSPTTSRRKKDSRRHRIRSAFGRTLSPWSYHSDVAKDQDKKKGSNSYWSRLNCRDSLDLEGEKRRGSNGEEKESGTESDGESIKGGITPRNNAFGEEDSEDSENDELGRETFISAKRPSRLSKDGSSSGDSTVKDSINQSGTDPDLARADEDDDSGEESDDYIDFDEQTLDNTLYNAGCIDLHDAWLKHDPHHNHASGTPDDAKSTEFSFQDDYYGPNDYDAAWSGAGPSGHDEEDEALRAPNVVIGQASIISPSQLAGEGMDVLRDTKELKQERRAASPFKKQRSRPTSVSSSGMGATRSSSSTRSEDNSKEEEEDGSVTSKGNLLTASRPVFERNRCTITLIHGDYDKATDESKRTKRYIVASDGSEESSYAIEWTIGTVLRDGDEMLVVSVMETEAKLDSTDAKNEDKAARQEHQRIRQSMAVILARRATAVLQRTRLAVKVSCQALHARNSRHMFIDMIDFFEPTMCIVGSRGLNSIKGVLLGSFSNYCVQKSPVPVMVARKRLKLPALPRGKGDVVSNVRARHLRLDEAVIEKDANVAEDKPEEQEKEKDEKDEKDEKISKEEDGIKSEKGKGEKGKEEVKMEKVNHTDGQEELSEAEKVKVAANVPSIETTPADEVESKRGIDSTSKAEEKEFSRGRATFSINDEDEGKDRGRSRSRSRTPDVKAKA